MTQVFYLLLAAAATVMHQGFQETHAFSICHHIKSSASFSTKAIEGTSRLQMSSDNAGGIEVMTLESLTDHEEEGDKLKLSIQGWLDIEWMPQEVHTQMGESAKQTYIRCREAGEDDIASIMTDITDDLFANWAKYDKDAFVNAWDIGNYVADYLHQRLGVEECSCHATVFNPDE
uniref:Uncharacterized protein n=1 Tax=Chaetoceros debilis TaxID=122233 RepID=A0A7S3V4C1_9STRA|mmetsp:Transcript_14854/g.21521  ORF Transcript_14854/g.21521 Transcript_14854/m.21521 type:complete len:175 (+) Transcript_14854:94-618(+)|eukprot:CAMPEP_0194073584 /NCGR_PEP_ID=MMETSP0149-20130528/951_1 /TAXON_ID=122233 /ORGANISM="Chaetoceros debilis, Strain MM31A-1" /LENGTH=174 /DNA_ID=CAMNT_0038753615 /DNA_START=80 /DNA_END=604 /DNA_ORIENTATION=+